MTSRKPVGTAYTGMFAAEVIAVLGLFLIAGILIELNADTINRLMEIFG